MYPPVPLDQQQQAEPRQAQDRHRQGVEQVQPQAQSRIGGGEVQRPHRAEPQRRVACQPQRQLQRRFEQPPDGHQQKQQHQPQRYLFYDRHAFPPFTADAAAQASRGSGTAVPRPVGIPARSLTHRRK